MEGSNDLVIFSLLLVLFAVVFIFIFILKFTPGLLDYFCKRKTQNRNNQHELVEVVSGHVAPPVQPLPQLQQDRRDFVGLRRWTGVEDFPDAVKKESQSPGFISPLQNTERSKNKPPDSLLTRDPCSRTKQSGSNSENKAEEDLSTVLKEHEEESKEGRGKNKSGDEGEQKTKVKQDRTLLSPKAISKHIYPDCKGREDAERFSKRRNRKCPTYKNTVLLVEENDFHLEGNYVVSNNRVRYYQCTKTPNGDFEVRMPIRDLSSIFN